MRYEMTIRQLEEFTEEELKESERRNRNGMDSFPVRYADKPFHEVRVLSVEVSQEEFDTIKKAVIAIF